MLGDNKTRFPNWGDGRIYDNRQIRVFQGIMEFYVIESIDIMTHTDYAVHSHAKWREEFDAFKKQYVEHFANAFFDYTVFVCLGEARHAYKRCDYCLDDFFEESDRRGAYNCPHLEPFSTLNVLSALFSKDWASSYGGAAWAGIANGGLKYHTYPDEIFLDHLVDLSHNNGIFYNKTNHIFSLNGTESQIEFFLDLKRDYSPQVIYGYCELSISYEIKKFFERAVNLGIITPLTDNEWETVEAQIAMKWPVRFPNQENVENILNYIPVKWGSSQLSTKDIIFTNNYSSGTRGRNVDNEDEDEDDEKGRFDREGWEF